MTGKPIEFDLDAKPAERLATMRYGHSATVKMKRRSGLATELG